MALITGTFVAGSGLVYFAFMTARPSMIPLIELSPSVLIGLGGIAFLVEAVNVMDSLIAARRVGDRA